jgi:hypothetical protein
MGPIYQARIHWAAAVVMASARRSDRDADGGLWVTCVLSAEVE